VVEAGRILNGCGIIFLNILPVLNDGLGMTVRLEKL